jgi:hypothetical protein
LATHFAKLGNQDSDFERSVDVGVFIRSLPTLTGVLRAPTHQEENKQDGDWNAQCPEQYPPDLSLLIFQDFHNLSLVAVRRRILG